MKKETQKILTKKDIIKKIKTYNIYVPIYDITLKLIDKTNSKKLDEMWGGENSYLMITGNHLKDTGDIYIQTRHYTRESLVHELYHSVDLIFEYIGGMRKPFEDKESRAYLMGYLFKEAIKYEKYLKK